MLPCLANNALLPLPQWPFDIEARGRHRLGFSRRAGPARIGVFKSLGVATVIGPRLLYALIVGAVIAAALVLRIWDPSPVARLRAVVFDTYQQISRANSTPACRCASSTSTRSLKRVGQWPWPRTVLAELVKKLADNGAAAVLDIVFARDRMRWPMPCASGRNPMPSPASVTRSSFPATSGPGRLSGKAPLAD